jgi:hypothetical protein
VTPCSTIALSCAAASSSTFLQVKEYQILVSFKAI